MPCVAVSYETQEAILLILCNILQSTPVTCRGQNWTHVLLFPSLFSVERRASVTKGGWHRNVGSKDKPPRFSLIAGLLLVIKNAPKGKCHSFSLSLMFNFQFWVMHWSLPRAVFLPGPALGILDTYKARCVLPFFLLSFGISSVIQVAPKKKGKPKSNTSQCCSCVMTDKRSLGKQASKSEGAGYPGVLIKPSSGFICVVSTDSQAETPIKGRWTSLQAEAALSCKPQSHRSVLTAKRC